MVPPKSTGIEQPRFSAVPVPTCPPAWPPRPGRQLRAAARRARAEDRRAPECRSALAGAERLLPDHRDGAHARKRRMLTYFGEAAVSAVCSLAQRSGGERCNNTLTLFLSRPPCGWSRRAACS
eukprot:scaffold911_cov63-Phaeocystis_antarctica.AAC.3